MFVGTLDFERRWGNFFLATIWGYVFHGNCGVPLFTSKLDLYLRKQLINCYNCSIACYGAETWTLQKVTEILESFEMWCWRG
jgi:hypothetical protein